MSCRFSASRVGRYNEHLYTFFKCLSTKRLSHVERWYAEQNNPGPEVPLGEWLVQRHCPHLRSDLTRFGEIDAASILTCHTHGWRFDLNTGLCLTADGHPIRAVGVSTPTTGLHSDRRRHSHSDPQRRDTTEPASGTGPIDHEHQQERNNAAGPPSQHRLVGTLEGD